MAHLWPGRGRRCWRLAHEDPTQSKRSPVVPVHWDCREWMGQNRVYRRHRRVKETLWAKIATALGQVIVFRVYRAPCIVAIAMACARAQYCL